MGFGVVHRVGGSAVSKSGDGTSEKLAGLVFGERSLVFAEVDSEVGEF